MTGLSAAAVERVNAFLAGIQGGDHDRGERVPVEPFTVDMGGKPREVIALELRADAHEDVLVFHVFEPIDVLVLTCTVGGDG